MTIKDYIIYFVLAVIILAVLWFLAALADIALTHESDLTAEPLKPIVKQEKVDDSSENAESETVPAVSDEIAETEETSTSESEILRVGKPSSKPDMTNPYHFRHELTNEEWRIAVSIVEGEAGDQDYTGKALVATCLLNACEKDGLEPSEVRTAYQYAGWKDDHSDETLEAVFNVFFRGKLPTDSKILYFYDPRYCNGSWHETQTFALEYGCHRFFCESE